MDQAVRRCRHLPSTIHSERSSAALSQATFAFASSINDARKCSSPIRPVLYSFQLDVISVDASDVPILVQKMQLYLPRDLETLWTSILSPRGIRM